MAAPDNELSEHDKVLLEVGRCLNAWSKVEKNLASFFVDLHLPHGVTPLDKYFPLRAAIDAVISFEARLTMIDASVKTSMLADALIKSKWPNLKNRLLKQYKKRHQVAHFELTIINSRPAIQPFPTFSASWSKTGEVPLTSKDIRKRTSVFEELTNETGAYCWYMGRHAVPSQFSPSITRAYLPLIQREAVSTKEEDN